MKESSKLYSMGDYVYVNNDGKKQIGWIEGIIDGKFLVFIPFAAGIGDLIAFDRDKVELVNFEVTEEEDDGNIIYHVWIEGFYDVQNDIDSAKKNITYDYNKFTERKGEDSQYG